MNKFGKYHEIIITSPLFEGDGCGYGRPRGAPSKRKISDSPLYIQAAEAAEVLWLSLERLKEANDGLAEELFRRFIKLLAIRALSQNKRI